MKFSHRDTFIHKGSHDICEDFVFEGQNSDFSYIILSDGCSSSPRSDISSSLMSLSAHKIFSKWAMTDREGISLDEFEKMMVDNMVEMNDYFHLNNNFDATLLVAYEYNDTINIKCFGDGIIGIKLKNKDWTFQVVDYSDNTPYYLSYKMHVGLDILYKSQDRIKTIDLYSKEENNRIVQDITSHIHLKFPVEDVESIILASDGLRSFSFNSNVKPIEEVLSDLVSFKNYEGSFLKRRLKRMIKDYSPFVNYDDVSVCILTRGEK